jgi:hypothetical protein
VTRLRTLEEIRDAGAALARTFQPLTDQQCERLAFLIAPTITAPAASLAVSALPLKTAA